MIELLSRAGSFECSKAGSAAVPARRRFHWTAMALALALAGGGAARAQMVTGKDMTGFAAAFGLDQGRAAQSYGVEQLELRVNGKLAVNALAPGEQPELLLRFENKTAAELKAHGRIEIVHWGTKAKPHDMWSPDVFRIDSGETKPIDVDLAPSGAQELRVALRIPATYGGYAVIVDLEKQGRAFVASLARVVAADPGRVQYPTYALDETWPEFMNENVFLLFQKLGIKGARMGAQFTPPGAPNFEAETKKFSEYIEWAGKHDVTAMLTVDNGQAPMPLGRPRPWLSNDGKMLDTKDDRAWLPQYDKDFRVWAKTIASRYGWPRS